VVVVGGGFAGLEAVHALEHVDAEITLVDRHNYHLFQPLTYQVATGSLSPEEIAVPLRMIFRRRADVRVLLGEVSGFDLNRRELCLAPLIAGAGPRAIPYDTLLVAGGSSYDYFGHDEWRPFALEVKSLDSALETRGRILQAFEAAELEDDGERRSDWLTFVVVGAGPTGVEIAGQLAELASDTLPREFRDSDPSAGRVLLIEIADRVLTTFPESLSDHARASLERVGVTPLLGQTVVGMDSDHVDVEDSHGHRMRIATRTIVWAAGVTASPLALALAEASGEQVDRAGRLTVEPDLTLAGHPDVLAVGDMVNVRDAQTGRAQVLPGLAPVAMQQGRYAGELIGRRLAREPTPPFRDPHNG
jgi:NADH dehydrogenase